ncbi:MAG TPA: SAM-dependent methyltransferase, partial [Dissulfurispiraceae bacterium]|nr:SAM-dependent methyltransferase [Dissulfurispiraceae bacterium]
MKQGKLFVVGVGPGDPELITLKAVRILRDVPAICVPKGKEEGTSLALSILRPVVSLEGKDVFEAHFPMRKTKDPDHESELGRKWDAITGAV